MVCNTYKIQSLFPLKDKVQHLNCVTCKGIFSGGQTYVDEIIRNCKISRDQHKDIIKSSESARHLGRNTENDFA